VNIKTIIRDKENLAIPENVEFTLKVNNAK
jgi:hypothetical protein